VQIGKPAGKRRPREGPGGAGSAMALGRLETVEVVPLFEKRDKRTISQITEEIKTAKRRRLDDAAAHAPGGAAGESAVGGQVERQGQDSAGSADT
jgi:hypothetical protein